MKAKRMNASKIQMILIRHDNYNTRNENKESHWPVLIYLLACFQRHIIKHFFFWAIAVLADIFSAGFCNETGRKHEHPIRRAVICPTEPFDCDEYLKQTIPFGHTSCMFNHLNNAVCKYNTTLTHFFLSRISSNWQ